MKASTLLACLCVLVLRRAEAQSAAAAARDPFRPPQPRGDQPAGPLQRAALEQLELAAVIVGGDVPRALLQDGEGTGYIVTVGSLVGARGGVVTSIEPARVVIEEPIDERGLARRINLDLFGSPTAGSLQGNRGELPALSPNPKVRVRR